MLYRNYTPDTVLEISDKIMDAIIRLGYIANIKVDLYDFKDRLYGRLKRQEPHYTKKQIERNFKKNEFDLQEYLDTLGITSYIRVNSFPVNLSGKLLSDPTPFGLHESYDSSTEKSIHNLLCKYQACLLMETLASILNQYLTFKFENSSSDIFHFKHDFKKEDIKELSSLQLSLHLQMTTILGYLSSIALFNDYEHDLVKFIVATRFLNMKSDNSGERNIKISLKSYIDHEYSQMSRADHEDNFRKEILNKLNIKENIC